MNAGQTLIGDNGLEVCLWPLQYLNLTQLSGPGSYSHCCGNVVDAVGLSTRTPIYAPFTCRKYYNGPYASGNQQQFCSVNKVNYGTGVDYVSFGFAHDNSTLYNVGDVIPQGTLIGYSGTAGGVADHSHIDVAIGQNMPFIDSGVTCSYQAQFGENCWMMRNSTSPENVWFINDTAIVGNGGLGLKFKTYEGGTPGPGPEPAPTDDTSKGMPLFMYLKLM